MAKRIASPRFTQRGVILSRPLASNLPKAIPLTAAKRASVLGATAWPALTNVTMPSFGLDVERSKSAYLSLWFHQDCGGQPEAYNNAHITCDNCSYSYHCPDGEPLGISLYNSLFQPKKEFPTWFV